jgi:hypothetical protein
MTTLRDTLAGFAQLKLPLRWRILALLMAAEVDQHPTDVSLREFSRLLGRPHQRWLRQELDFLVETRIISRERFGGSAPDRYRLRPIEDWLEPRWAVSRQDALHNVAFVRDCRARQMALFAQGDSGALGVVARRRVRRGKWRLRAGGTGAQMDTDRASDTGAQTPPSLLTPSDPSCSRDEISLTEGEREAVFDLSKRLAVRCGVPDVWGTPLSRLEKLVATGNGNLAKVMTEAGAPGGPDKLLARVSYLEDVARVPAQVPAPAAGPTELLYDPDEDRWCNTVGMEEQRAAKLRAWRETHPELCDQTG